MPVKILRDTGAFDSYIVSSVLPFSQETDTGDYVLMRGMDLTVLPVPLHKLVLNCGLVQGEVAMGVHPAHGENSVGSPVFQIVVPSKFREEVLKTSHD